MLDPFDRVFTNRVFFLVQYLKEFQNYNALMAVTGALTNTCIARLHITNNYIPKNTKQVRERRTRSGGGGGGGGGGGSSHVSLKKFSFL